MKHFVLFFAFLLYLFVFVGNVNSVGAESCGNRFVTIVNPVRGRDLWFDKTLKPLEDQYSLIKKYEFSATWLLTYDSLLDEQIFDYFASMDERQEFGLFLEVSPTLAKDSRVIYPHNVAWFFPNAVFLSGYSQSDRIKILDTIFGKFKKKFGYYPRSVGAWWIDSYSISYMRSRYKVSSVLRVADQLTTDNYGVWGGWWGVPYYPSKGNLLVPASEKVKKEDVVVIQWAQRDLSKAYGEGTVFSNYSLQANDYTERGLATDYFEGLVNSYLDCQMPIGQVTVGLETGMESVKAFSEYQKQMEFLNSLTNVKKVRMSDFASEYVKLFANNPDLLTLSDGISSWEMTPHYRKNEKLGDYIQYGKNVAFSDYFVKDNSEFLDRKLPLVRGGKVGTFPFFVFVSLFLIFLPFSIRLGFFEYFLLTCVFVLVSFFPLFMSFSKFGWYVLYGPLTGNLFLTQVLVFVFFGLIFFALYHKFNLNKLWLLYSSLLYGLDFFLVKLRYTKLDGVNYIGLMWDNLRLLGFSFGRKIELVNRDLPSVVASSLIKFDIFYYWQKPVFFYFIIPIVHLLLGAAVLFMIKKFPVLKPFVLFFLFLFFVLYMKFLLSLDPVAVL